jgi:hypothetical protein
VSERANQWQTESNETDPDFIALRPLIDPYFIALYRHCFSADCFNPLLRLFMSLADQKSYRPQKQLLFVAASVPSRRSGT